MQVGVLSLDWRRGARIAAIWLPAIPLALARHLFAPEVGGFHWLAGAVFVYLAAVLLRAVLPWSMTEGQSYVASSGPQAWGAIMLREVVLLFCFVVAIGISGTLVGAGFWRGLLIVGTSIAFLWVVSSLVLREEDERPGTRRIWPRRQGN